MKHWLVRLGMNGLLFCAVAVPLAAQVKLPIGIKIPPAVSALTSRALLPLTEGEASDGLKEALVQGIQSGVDLLSAPGGFLNNATYRLGLPPEIEDIENKIHQLPVLKRTLEPSLDHLKVKLNEAAELAMLKAFPIFKSAVMGLSVRDALGIVRGDVDSATHYLESETESALRQTFMPIIQNSLDEVAISRYWEPVAVSLNANKKWLGRTEDIQPDLAAFVHEKATAALFMEIAKEEKAIRESSARRTTALLQKVFAQK